MDVEKLPRFGHAVDVWEEKGIRKWNPEHIKEMSVLPPIHRWKKKGGEAIYTYSAFTCHSRSQELLLPSPKH